MQSSDPTAQHDAIRVAMGQLIIAPVDLTRQSIRILDSGTGDGYWLQDLMTQYPQLREPQLVGTDITDAKFPKHEASLSLQIQSITKPWPLEWHKSFDFVHQRLVLGACGSFPFNEAVKNLTELVKPGGWIQLVECDQVCGVKDGPAMEDFLKLVTWVFEDMGGDIRYAYGVKSWLQNAGMIRVEERGIPLFLGAMNPDHELAKRTARSTADAMLPLIKYAQGKSPPLSAEKVESLVSRLYEELLESGGYYPMRVTWGQAPLEQ